MERLRSLDAEFLHIEDGVAHMHIAGACVFDGTPPNYDLLIDLVAGKMHEIPQYRQRIRPVPLELGRPLWVDDPHFDLRYHVRHTALPAPGDEEMFSRLLSRLMSQPLDRARPLWEVWMVEGLDEGRWALVCKVHHSMVDGIAGVQLLTALLDIAPTATALAPRPWSPRPEPTPIAKVLNAWSGLISDAAATTRQVADSLRHPTRAISSATSTVRGAGAFLASLGTTTKSSSAHVIGPHRTWANSSAPLAEVKAIGKTFGGTVNDVVVAAIAGSWRELLVHQGADPATTIIRSGVPVSTRGADAHGVPDNRVSLLLYDLPVSVADPVERLATVREELGELKQAHMTQAADALVSISDLAPPMVVAGVSRMAVRVMQRIPQRSIDTITTNVPGPQFPLYCLGREMLELRPFVPIAHGIPLATAIMSYNGSLFFGVSGDYSATDDAEQLATGTVDAIDELYALAVPTSSPSSRSTTRSTAKNAGGSKTAGPKPGRTRTPKARD